MKTLLSLFLLALLPGLSAEIQYSSWVQSHYKGKRDLEAWAITETAIKASFDEWDQRSSSGTRTIDGGKSDLVQALRPQQSDADHILYVAAHQKRNGHLSLIDKSSLQWNEVVTPAMDSRFKLTILDACFASSAQLQQKINSQYLLYASNAEERTWELWVKSRRPMDFRKRYPQAVAWLERKIGEPWDGHISYLGFVWTLAYLETPQAPHDDVSWESFLDLCQKKSQAIAATRARKSSSEIHWVRKR